MEKINFNELRDKEFGKRLHGLSTYYGIGPLIMVIRNILSGFSAVTTRRLDTLKPKAKEYVISETKSRLRAWKKRNDLFNKK